MKLEITCTRAEADHKQISRCRESLDKTSKTISEMGKIFSLAGNETRLKILFFRACDAQVYSYYVKKILSFNNK